MDVAIDQAWEEEKPRDVDALAEPGLRALNELTDLAIADDHVGSRGRSRDNVHDPTTHQQRGCPTVFHRRQCMRRDRADNFA
jgi:hypothetical protein